MNLVDAAREKFKSGDPEWPQELLLALPSRIAAYEWVEHCVRLLLPRLNTDAHESLFADLESLRALRESNASGNRILECAREIWDKPPFSDGARRVVSRLYEA